MDKKELRLSLLERRDSLEDISLSICRQIIETHLLDNVKRVGIYYPLKKEINLLSLLDYYRNIEFCFPKTEDEISFYSENDLTNFQEAKFHVMEPNSNNLVQRDDIDLFLIPTVGITKDMQRIGYGKGYYDRYLNGYKGIKVGICYKQCANLDFKCDDWDLKFDQIVLG